MDFSEEIQDLPSYVAAYGWIPFVVAILVTLLISFLYVKHFSSQNERDKCSTGTATLGITLALLASLLLPVDVFLVSYMKNSDGSFKDWATNSTREEIENTVTYAYYSIYSIILIYSFFILPLVYFYYEEREDDHTISVFPRALLYTVIFILVITALLVAGLLIPFKRPPAQNSTEWERLEFIVDDLSRNRGRDALSFVVHVLTVYGMLNLIMYTGVGLAAFPISLIKGFRSLAEEERILSDNQTSTQAKINALKSKQSKNSLSSREIAALNALEEEESVISRRSLLLESEKTSFWQKVHPGIRFVSLISGIIFIIFSVIFWVSLLICNIDRLLHSLGYKMGYALSKSTLLNPLDFIFLQSQKVFPLDYVFFFAIIIYLVVCTISGIRHFGICCLCVPMYKVRPKRTVPQGLVMLSFILMFAVFAFHIIMFAVLPTYSTFGSQLYCETNNSTCVPTECTLDAPADTCIMTRSATFLLIFAFKAWIFSCAYFWLTWGFLLSFLLSLILNLLWSRRSALEEAIDKDDFDDSYDDAMITA